MLFPNVAHLAVGSRVLRYTSDYYGVNSSMIPFTISSAS